ncbi:MAG: FAD:protein FMN transferase [Pseudomonadota bacterium]
MKRIDPRHAVIDLTTLSRRAVLLSPLALMACKASHKVIDIVGFSMGTTYQVVAVDKTRELQQPVVKEAVEAALAEVNAAMSNWDDSSEVSRLNAAKSGEKMRVSPAFVEVVEASREVSRLSAGHFDATVGLLIELWGFGAPERRGVPTDEAIAAARNRAGMERLVVAGSDTIQKTRDDTQVYLAGIGKGYGADRIGRALRDLGIEDFLVEIGGDLYAEGRNPDGVPWQIGIESPNAEDRSVLGVVGLSGRGLASSGDYRNYFEVDGERYSHLIDPTTGRPVTHKTASATVIAENAMLADAWSTGMLILGRERGLEIAADNGIAVQFVERDPGEAELAFTTFTSQAFDNETA